MADTHERLKLVRRLNRRSLLAVSYRRSTIFTLMIVIAVSAMIMNWLRPISPGEATRIAEARFQALPRADNWAGRYKIQTEPAGTLDTDQPGRFADGWTVLITDPRNGYLIMQVHLTPRGNLRAMDFAPGIYYGTAGK